MFVGGEEGSKEREGEEERRCLDDKLVYSLHISVFGTLSHEYCWKKGQERGVHQKKNLLPF